MDLHTKALEMRNAIDAIELALSACDFPERAVSWEDARDDLTLFVRMKASTLRQIANAYDELNRIINSPEYAPSKLK